MATTVSTTVSTTINRRSKRVSLDHINGSKFWDTSKCNRLLRPLKLKISALKRSVSKTHDSVADGMTAWSSLSDRPSSRPSPATGNSGDIEAWGAAYKPGPPRKYGGANRKHRPIMTIESQLLPDLRDFSGLDLIPEHFITKLRRVVNPTVASAYVDVYYAFVGILSRTVAVEPRFPNLAARCAKLVGRCVHLTSSSARDGQDFIESDIWYEAAPAHERHNVVIGHAVQILISNYTVLAPVFPALVLAAIEIEEAGDLLEAIFEAMSWDSLTKKSDVSLLLAMSAKIGKPYSVNRYLCRNFHVDFVRTQAFLLLANPGSRQKMSDPLIAFYTVAITCCLRTFRSCEVGVEEEFRRIGHVIELLSERVCREDDATTIVYYSALFTQGCVWTYPSLSLLYTVAALRHFQSDPNLVAHLTKLHLHISETQDKSCYFDACFRCLEPDRLTEITEVLVGRVDDLAILLAQECAKRFEDNFVTWAENIERSVMEAKSEGEGNWRYEPLLDSWVASTPGLVKVKHATDLLQTCNDESSDNEITGYLQEKPYRRRLSGSFKEHHQAEDLMRCHDGTDRQCLPVIPPFGFGHVLSEEKDLISPFSSPKHQRLSSNVTLIMSARKISKAERNSSIANKYLGENSPLKLNFPVKRCAIDSPIVEHKRRRYSSNNENSAPSFLKRHPVKECHKILSRREPLRELSAIDRAYSRPISASSGLYDGKCPLPIAEVQSEDDELSML